MITHDAVVAGEVRFAFAAIDDQCRDLRALAQRQLGCRRECGATETDDAGSRDAVGDFFRRKCERIGWDIGFGGAVFAIGLKRDGHERQSGRVRRRNFTDRRNGA